MTDAARIAMLEAKLSDALAHALRTQEQLSDHERRLHLLRGVVAAHPDAETLLSEWEIQAELSPANGRAS